MHECVHCAYFIPLSCRNTRFISTPCQMERDEDSAIVQERPSSLYHPLSLIHHNTVLRVNHHVSLVHALRSRVAMSGRNRVGFHCCIAADILFSQRSYLPTLIPVEVEESRAKWWFSSLLSGVDFLHKRGVVHNDIKSVFHFGYTRIIIQIVPFVGPPTFYLATSASLFSWILALLRSTMLVHPRPSTAILSTVLQR